MTVFKEGMHLNSSKYSPKYSGSKIALVQKRSPSLDSTIAVF